MNEEQTRAISSLIDALTKENELLRAEIRLLRDQLARDESQRIERR